jgi:hypothetical protein
MAVSEVRWGSDGSNVTCTVWCLLVYSCSPILICGLKLEAPGYSVALASGYNTTNLSASYIYLRRVSGRVIYDNILNNGTTDYHTVCKADQDAVIKWDKRKTMHFVLFWLMQPGVLCWKRYYYGMTMIGCLLAHTDAVLWLQKIVTDA